MDPARPRTERDRAIDILRGLALVTITINHLTGFVFRGGMKGTPFPTLSHWGFSSAAEIFFLLSGYLIGAVYLRADRDQRIDIFARKMGARAARLYVYNGLLFLSIVPLCLLSPTLSRYSFYSYFIGHGAPAWIGFALLYIQPYCLEILVTYTIFLLAAPIVAWGMIRRPWAIVLLSFALYIVAYRYNALKLPGGTPAGDWRWNFSPASWQFLFFGAMAAGRFRLLDRLKARLLADRRWFVAAAALFGALTLLFLAQTWLTDFGVQFQVPWQSKVRAGPIRIIHALSASIFLLGLLWLWPRVQNLLPARALATIGAASLQSFVASVFISYVAGLIWIELAPGYYAYLILSAASALALALFAQGHRLIRARPKLAAIAQPA